MYFNILGPLSMLDAGNSRLPSAPKTRQLLALFLMHENSSVSVAKCLEELWEISPPRTAVQSIQTRIFHIRKYLAESPSIETAGDAKNILAIQNGGYVLRVRRGSLDRHELEKYIDGANHAQKIGDDDEVSNCLRKALSMWRGSTLSDIQAGPVLQPRIASLEELKLTLWERCIEAELRLGMHHDLLPELEYLVSQNPFNENIHAQYIIALYRSQRVGQALEVYHTLRQVLNKNLGIDPSSQMRNLQTAVLSGDPRLAIASPLSRKLSLDLFSAR